MLTFQHSETNSEVELFSNLKRKRKRNYRGGRSNEDESENPTYEVAIGSLLSQIESKTVENLKQYVNTTKLYLNERKLIIVDQYSRLEILPLKPVTEVAVLVISFDRSYVYIAGRYNKFSRTLSQTPWVIDGVRKTPSSVEELLGCPLVELLQASGMFRYIYVGKFCGFEKIGF
jgi:hypothetical protein